MLWGNIRSNQINERKFRRQVPVGQYILDFYCPELNLCIELDGGQHSGDVAKDKKRSSYLNEKGIRVVRFWNHDVIRDLEAVLNEIWRLTR